MLFRKAGISQVTPRARSVFTALTPFELSRDSLAGCGDSLTFIHGMTGSQTGSQSEKSGLRAMSAR